MPSDDSRRAPHVRPSHRHVGPGHLFTLAIVRDRGNLNMQVGSDVRCRPPLCLWISNHHAPKDTVTSTPPGASPGQLAAVTDSSPPAMALSNCAPCLAGRPGHDAVPDQMAMV